MKRPVAFPRNLLSHFLPPPPPRTCPWFLANTTYCWFCWPAFPGGITTTCCCIRGGGFTPGARSDALFSPFLCNGAAANGKTTVSKNDLYWKEYYKTLSMRSQFNFRRYTPPVQPLNQASLHRNKYLAFDFSALLMFHSKWLVNQHYPVALLALVFQLATISSCWLRPLQSVG